MQIIWIIGGAVVGGIIIYIFLSKKEIRDLLVTLNKVQSYDVPMTEEDSSGSFFYIIKSDDGDTNAPDKPLLFNESLKIDMKRAMSSLTERECSVLEMFFGVGKHSKPLSIEDIAERFELSDERVRQIKEKAVRRMKTYNRANLLKKYMN
jgi:RNA polymerase primary sigma factor